MKRSKVLQYLKLVKWWKELNKYNFFDKFYFIKITQRHGKIAMSGSLKQIDICTHLKQNIELRLSFI